MYYNFTDEEFASILAFVNGENNNVLKTDVPKRFISFSSAFQAKMLESLHSTRSECHAKTRALERAQGRLANKIENGEIGEMHLNSIDVALAIVHLLREKYRFESFRQVNFIMYQFYARFLHETSMRPWENDRPVLQEWGPQFWGAANKLQKAPYGAGTYEDYRKITQIKGMGPMMANMLKNVVAKYSDNTSEKKLQEECLESFPYRNALKKKNDMGLKWGDKISDADLYSWKQ